MLGALAVNIHVQDTYFVVGHFHYVMFGGTGFALFAAMHYWFPKMFGKMYRKGPAVLSWILATLGFNTMYMPFFFLGYMGMPGAIMTIFSTRAFMSLRRSVPDPVLSVIIMIVNLLYALKKGAATSNPREEDAGVDCIVAAADREFCSDSVVTTGPYDFSGMNNIPRSTRERHIHNIL
jgi:cytochrome c oxidase subunit 1